MTFVNPTQEIEAQRKQYIQVTEALNHLMNSPGWKLMEADLKMQEDKAFEDLAKAMTADAALVAKQAFVTIRKIRTWPQIQFDHAVQGVRQLPPVVPSKK